MACLFNNFYIIINVAINPNPNGAGLALNISENDNALDFDLAREVASLFRIDTDAADSFIRQTEESIQNWRKIADRCALSRPAQDDMASAFADKHR